MTLDFIKIYEAHKQKYGKDAYRRVSEVLKEAEAQHEKTFAGNDRLQSWRAVKGKGLEKLIKFIINDEVAGLGLKIADGNALERKKNENLSDELRQVRENILIHYRGYGPHLPDADIIIYEPTTSKVLAVLSIKATLRERIAQTGYWKIKLQSQESTKHIQVFFITPDEDKALAASSKTKSRAIVEEDVDCSYVLSETTIEESEKVKMFDKFIDNLKGLLEKNAE